jgi:hypothetical protein
MGFPTTLAAMEQAGYKRVNFGRCSGCNAAIEWWTTPTKARMPMDPMPDPESIAVSHFTTCVHAKRFKKKAPQRAKDAPPQPSLFLLKPPGGEK